MLRVGFEPTISVFERAKTVHGLERAATVIGSISSYRPTIWEADSAVKYIKNYVSAGATD
jgi:hypothetical protein